MTDWASAEQANQILPPVTYGVAPTGSEIASGPLDMPAGESYALILFRFLPEEIAAGCEAALRTLCRLGVHTFVK